MSVPVGIRTVSKVEFLHLAKKLKRDITFLLIRDFGVKSISRNLKSFAHSAKMNEADRTAFYELCNKYHIDVEAEWPVWLMDEYRNNVLQLLRLLKENIVTANTIYPTEPDFEYWHNLRRKHQKLAQANCYQLLDTFQDICEILPVDKEKLMPYVGMLEHELNAIKNWQKRTNQQFKKYLENRKS